MAYEMEFQTRSEETGIEFYPTLERALKHAEKDETVWKISFSLPNDERIRLVKDKRGGFVLEQLDMDALEVEVKHESELSSISFVSMKDWPKEATIVLIQALGYNVDKGYIVDENYDRVRDKYTGEPIKVDNFIILPTDKSFIFLENDHFSLIEHSAEFPKIWDRLDIEAKLDIEVGDEPINENGVWPTETDKIAMIISNKDLPYCLYHKRYFSEPGDDEPFCYECRQEASKRIGEL